MPRAKKGQQKVQILQKTTVRFVITLHLLLGNSWRCSWAGPGTWSRSETSSIPQILISENILFNRAGHMRDNCCLTTWHRFNRAGTCATTVAWQPDTVLTERVTSATTVAWQPDTVLTERGTSATTVAWQPDTVLTEQATCATTVATILTPFYGLKSPVTLPAKYCVSKLHYPPFNDQRRKLLRFAWHFYQWFLVFFPPMVYYVYSYF